jgi:hypothetical protein
MLQINYCDAQRNERSCPKLGFLHSFKQCLVSLSKTELAKHNKSMKVIKMVLLRFFNLNIVEVSCSKLIIVMRNATKEAARLNYFTADFLGKSSLLSR